MIHNGKNRWAPKATFKHFGQKVVLIYASLFVLCNSTQLLRTIIKTNCILIMSFMTYIFCERDFYA